MAYTAGADGRTVPYRAPAGSPWGRLAERAAALLAATEYTRQVRVLDRPLDAAPVGGSRLGPMEVVGSDAEGWRTRTTWSGDSTVLLPVADEIVFGDRVLAWDDLVVAAVEGFDPPRYHVINRP
jgi:hypothetical protein